MGYENCEKIYITRYRGNSFFCNSRNPHTRMKSQRKHLTVVKCKTTDLWALTVTWVLQIIDELVKNANICTFPRLLKVMFSAEHYRLHYNPISIATFNSYQQIYINPPPPKYYLNSIHVYAISPTGRAPKASLNTPSSGRGNWTVCAASRTHTITLKLSIE